MIVGKAMKARPMPELATSETGWLAACAMKPSAANTPIPHSSSKEELAKPTTRPEPVRSAFFFT